MTMETKKKTPPREEEAEVVNTWELMEDLEEAPISVQPKKKSSKSKSRVFLRGLTDLDAKSPLKLLNQMASPKKLKRFGGKENKLCHFNGFDSPNWKFSVKGSVTDGKCDNSRIDSGIMSKRRSVGQLFDKKLERSFEKKLSEEEEEEEEDIKKMVSATPITRRARNSRDSCVSILNLFEKKCPPRSENSVVIYTTTLRGIRKTFEDCNTVRSIMESHHIQMFERDVSMDSGFREELRGLMGGGKEVKVPVVFVKGRLIGGADGVVKLDEEGRLGILLDRIPRMVGACVGCAGIRFVVCMDCSGSCKVLDGNGRKTAKCGGCNENGLIQCPICC